MRFFRLEFWADNGLSENITNFHFFLVCMLIDDVVFEQNGLIEELPNLPARPEFAIRNPSEK